MGLGSRSCRALQAEVGVRMCPVATQQGTALRSTECREGHPG